MSQWSEIEAKMRGGPRRQVIIRSGDGREGDVVGKTGNR